MTVAVFPHPLTLNAPPFRTPPLQKLDFFDSTVIPLAKKLVSCGILGEAAEELLENSFLNRDEWEVQGHAIMKIYLEHYQEAHINQPKPAEPDESPNVEECDALLSDDDVVVSLNHSQPQGSGALVLGESRESPLSPTQEVEGPKSSSNEQLVTEGQNCEQTAVTEDTTKGDPAAPPLILGTANSSVAGTTSYAGTESETTDQDIVFAILENLDAPDDFDSYILITPKQKRQLEAKAKEEKTQATSNRRMRRVRRTRSSNGGNSAHHKHAFRRASTVDGGSTHTRRSMASLSSAMSSIDAGSIHTRRSMASLASAVSSDSCEESVGS